MHGQATLAATVREREREAFWWRRVYRMRAKGNVEAEARALDMLRRMGVQTVAAMRR